MAYPTHMFAAATTEPSILFVAIMGMTIVMIGLVCIILLCMLVGRICQLLERGKKNAADSTEDITPMQAAPDPQRGELVAAITAAVAEELGTDVSAIRVHSLTKIH